MAEHWVEEVEVVQVVQEEREAAVMAVDLALGLVDQMGGRAKQEAT